MGHHSFFGSHDDFTKKSLLLKVTEIIREISLTRLSFLSDLSFKG